MPQNSCYDVGYARLGSNLSMSTFSIESSIRMILIIAVEVIKLRQTVDLVKKGMTGGVVCFPHSTVTVVLY